MLRGLGELKSQNIRSQDVGRQYYDLESRLRAARTMEERLLKIIKEGKGEIKDLLLAEKELGEWRTKIESYEGEKRYFDNQIGLSTLTVTLTEKEIRSASAVTETERVQVGLEVEDVEKAHKAALAAVAESKGRVTKSELKQLAAGQFSALIHFEVAPDASGPLRDRFKQLGTVARLDIDRVQETEGSGGKVQEGLKVRLKDTQFFVSIYNLANVSPRETVVLSLACVDAEASYKTILARIEKAGGRVVTSSLNRQKNDQTAGTLRFEVKTVEADGVLQDVRAAGEVMRLDVSENPDTQNVTKSKRGFQVQLFGMGLVEPKETTTLTIAAKDVPAAYRALQEALAGAEARIFTSQLNENDRQNVNASLGFDFRRDNDAKVTSALMAAGDVLTRNSGRSQDVERVVESKRRINLTLVNLANIPVRDIYTIAVETDPVDAAVSALEALASESKGRIINSQHTRGAGGRNVSRITIDLPLSAARGAADKVKGLGMLRVFDTTRNAQAPEGELAMGRLDVTLSNPSQLVDSESGPWARIKGGLSVGLTALSWSLTLVVVGLCFVVPVGLLGWAGMKLYRKTKAA
jgi:glycine cleavage system regulatory protein